MFGFTHLDLSGRIPYDAVRGVAGVALKVGTAKKKKNRLTVPSQPHMTFFAPLAEASSTSASKLSILSRMSASDKPWL